MSPSAADRRHRHAGPSKSCPPVGDRQARPRSLRPPCLEGVPTRPGRSWGQGWWGGIDARAGAGEPTALTALTSTKVDPWESRIRWSVSSISFKQSQRLRCSTAGARARSPRRLLGLQTGGRWRAAGFGKLCESRGAGRARLPAAAPPGGSSAQDRCHCAAPGRL